MLWICLIINSGSKIVYLCIFSSCRNTCCGSAQQLNKSKSDEGFIYDKSVKDQNTLLKNHFEIMKWYVVSPWKILWIVTHGNNKAQIHTKIVLWTNNIFVKKNPNTNIVRRVIESRFYGSACKLSGRPGVLTLKIAVGRPELHSRSSVGRPDLLPLNLSLTLRPFSTSFEVHQPSK